MKAQGSAHKYGSYSPGAAREALDAIRRNRGGAILVTSGHQDVRLVIEGRRASVEVNGVEPEGDDPWALCRIFLNTLFWGDSTYFLELDGKVKDSAPAVRLAGNPTRALESLDQGIQELTSLRDQVPGMDVLVHVMGDPPPSEVESCAANLFRALGKQPRHLGLAADSAGLDEIDAAWAVADLLESEQAGVRRAPPTTFVRRLKSAEPLVDDGLQPAVRHLHLSRGFMRSDPARSARHLSDAGSAFLSAGLFEDALEAFRGCLEFFPKDAAGLEGMVDALEGLGRKGEAKQIRVDLIERYRSWHLPSRVLLHLDALGNLDAGRRRLRLDCLLEHRDFDGALEFARGMMPDLKAEERYELARTFWEAGANEAQRQRMLRLVGVHRMRWPRRVLMLVALGFAVGCAVLTGEVVLRLQFQRAANTTSFELQSGNFAELTTPWSELQKLREQAAQVPLPAQAALARVAPVVEELESIQADNSLLSDQPELLRALDWKAWPQTSDALTAMESLSKRAKSESLRRRIALLQAEVEEYHEVVLKETKQFNALTQTTSKLERGLSMLREHKRAAHLFAKEHVVVEVEALPDIKGLTVEWIPEGRPPQAAKKKTRSRYEIEIPLKEGASGTLLVRAPYHLRDKRKLVLGKNVKALEIFELIRSVRVKPTITHPSKRLKLPAAQALIVLTPKISPRRFVSNGFSGVREEPSAADLEFLRKHLKPGERLILELVTSVEPGKPPQVFLSGIRLWLDRGKTQGKGRLLDFRGTFSGLRRPLAKDGEFALVKSVAQTRSFDRVHRALPRALELERGQ